MLSKFHPCVRTQRPHGLRAHLILRRLVVRLYHYHVVSTKLAHHLRKYLFPADRVDHACLEDIRILQYRAVTLGERQYHWHALIVGVAHDVGHLVAVGGTDDEVRLHGRIVQLVDCLKAIVRVENFEVYIGSCFRKAVKRHSDTLVELNISAALECVALFLGIDATLTEFFHLGIRVKRQHQEDVQSRATGLQVVVVLSPLTLIRRISDIRSIYRGRQHVVSLDNSWYPYRHATFQVISCQPTIGIQYIVDRNARSLGYRV